MVPFILKYFFLLLTSMFAFYKILNIRNFSAKNHLINFCFAITTALFTTTIYDKTFFHKTIFIFIMLFIYLKCITKTPLLLSFISTITALSLSYISLTISGLLICIFLVPFQVEISSIPVLVYVICSSILQCFLLFALFRIKRLQHGIPFVKCRKFIKFGTIICVLPILVFIYFYTPNFTLFPHNIIGLVLILLLAIALLVWWRRKITQSYVEKLRVSEVESLYKEISDKDLEIEKLRASNDQLAGIIHKDNKLIPAMELAVRNYLQTAALMKAEDAKQLGADLLANLERMSEDRTGIIRAYQENTSYRQRTGLSSIDAIVDYMENRASSLGIDYHYQYDKGIKEKLSAYISEDDAMHLLSDLIENAIIAASHSEKKVVHIHIGFIQDILFMDISDGGIPFKPETYQNLGMHQHTTHADDGGSGIGLMDLGKLKKQYKFSLQIYEYPIDESVHTKKIRILFDRKNHYLIQSYRAREIRSVVMRNDLHVFQYVDSENEIPILEDKSKRSV